MAELTGRNFGFIPAENTDELFVRKTLIHGDVLMWLMKTLLTSVCIYQREAVNYPIMIGGLAEVELAAILILLKHLL